MLENESIRICEFIGVFQISSILTDNRDGQTIKIFKKMWQISGKYESLHSLLYIVSNGQFFFISIPIISSLFEEHVFKILQIFPGKYFSKTWGVNRYNTSLILNNVCVYFGPALCCTNEIKLYLFILDCCQQSMISESAEVRSLQRYALSN